MTSIEKYLKASKTPTINVTNVTFTLNETFQWAFSGLNVNVSKCRLDSVRLFVKPDSRSSDENHLVENPLIMTHNSSFRNLNLGPGTKAQITQCYIDAKFKQRRTLITATNSDVSIQNCHLENFINENNSTILFGHNNSHVTIENSVFIKHNSSKGVFLLQSNSSMRISSSLMSQNVALTLGYSAISLYDGTNAVVKSSMFKNNSALTGGVLIAENQCQVTLSNCTFSSNQVTRGKTLNIQKSLNPQRTSHIFPVNGTYKTVSPTLFNHTSSRYLHWVVHTRDPDDNGYFILMPLPFFNQTSNREMIASHRIDLLVKSSIWKTNSAQQKGVLPGFGGTINLSVQSQLLVTNCVFENNFAGGGGAIAAQQSAIIDIQETTFVSNTALKYGGAIVIIQQVDLRITNCLFDDNTCQSFGGAIASADNIALDIHWTNFTRNSVLLQGGAIHIESNSHLRVTDCSLEDNHAGQGGAIAGGVDTVLEINGSYFSENSASGVAGAILSGNNVTLNIQGTCFVGNKALNFGGAIAVQYNATLTVRKTNFVRNKAASAEAGAIDVGYQAYLRVRNCVFDENFSQGGGGAINGAENITLDIRETNFTRNTAAQGGAINVNTDVSHHAVNCIFQGSYGGNVGGHITGVYWVVNGSYLLGNNASTIGEVLAEWNVTLDVQEASFAGNDVNHAQTQAHLRFFNCSFDDNTSQQRRGAIHGVTNVALEIQRTNFTRNSVVDGGAISACDQVDLSLVHCRLDFKLVSDDGGTIAAGVSVKLKIRETSLICNSARNQGEAFDIGSQSECQIASCVFYSNTAKAGGGAVYIDSKALLKIQNTNFTNNNGSDGGGICIQENSKLQALIDSAVVIESCHFVSNYAVTDSGGAVNIHNPEHVSIMNTFFLRNVASNDGGAMYIIGGTVTIDNITCVGNQAAGGGGCLNIASVTLTLNNSDISENGVEHDFGFGIFVLYSRIQVCSITNIFQSDDCNT